jgi:hypothetical protein
MQSDAPHSHLTCFNPAPRGEFASWSHQGEAVRKAMVCCPLLAAAPATAARLDRLHVAPMLFRRCPLAPSHLSYPTELHRLNLEFYFGCDLDCWHGLLFPRSGWKSKAPPLRKAARSGLIRVAGAASRPPQHRVRIVPINRPTHTVVIVPDAAHPMSLAARCPKASHYGPLEYAARRPIRRMLVGRHGVRLRERCPARQWFRRRPLLARLAFVQPTKRRRVIEVLVARPHLRLVLSGDARHQAATSRSGPVHGLQAFDFP